MADNNPMPRSTGKQRASLIELDYYKKPNRLLVWKRILCVVATLAALIYLATGFVGQSAARYSHGPLSQVHATWDAQCSACHNDFEPIEGHALATSWQPEAAHNADQKCQTCHQGPEHHCNQFPAEVAHCASCHQDHQGRQVDLTRPADHVCTTCHDNLSAHTDPTAKCPRSSAPVPDAAKKITRFDVDHPEIRSPTQPTERTLKFAKKAHWLHMQPGLALYGTDDKNAKRLSWLFASDRPRYTAAGQAETDFIQLQCASCHHSESTPSPASPGALVNVARTAPDSVGAYLQPVQYDRDCRACHALNFGSQDEVLPHGLDAAHLDKYLQGYYSAQLVQENPDFLEAEFTPPKVPSKDMLPAARTLADQLASKIRVAEKAVSAKCVECHEVQSGDKDKVVTVPVVKPVNTPLVWLPHARFDHAAHHALNCAQCHDGATPDSGLIKNGRLELNETQRQELAADTGPLLPKLQTCKECHAPHSVGEHGVLGGARFDCVECHRYHGGDEPVHDRGAASRSGETNMAIEQFLQGATAKPSKSE